MTIQTTTLASIQGEKTMNEIFVGSIVFFAVVVISIALRDAYIRWLERKLAMARKDLAVLRKERQQPWLTGATTEYHLQKRITELEKENETLRGVDDGTEKCMNCNSMVEQVWHASDEFWNELSGYPQGNGVLCSRCFDRKAKAQEVYLYWTCQPNSFPKIDALLTRDKPCAK